MTEAFLPCTTKLPVPLASVLSRIASSDVRPAAGSLPFLLLWWERWPALSLRVRCKLRRSLLLSSLSRSATVFWSLYSPVVEMVALSEGSRLDLVSRSPACLRKSRSSASTSSLLSRESGEDDKALPSRDEGRLACGVEDGECTGEVGMLGADPRRRLPRSDLDLELWREPVALCGGVWKSWSEGESVSCAISSGGGILTPSLSIGLWGALSARPLDLDSTLPATGRGVGDEVISESEGCFLGVETGDDGESSARSWAKISR